MDSEFGPSKGSSDTRGRSLSARTYGLPPNQIGIDKGWARIFLGRSKIRTAMAEEKKSAAKKPESKSKPESKPKSESKPNASDASKKSKSTSDTRNGKGDGPRNIFSEEFRSNFDAIDWSK